MSENNSTIPTYTTERKAEIGRFVEVTPRNFRVSNFVAEIKAITADGRYILWYGQYSIWERHEFVVLDVVES